MHQITTLEEFVKFVPALKALHAQPGNDLEPYLTTAQFADRLLQQFHPGNDMFGEFSYGNELKYFMATLKGGRPRLTLWLLYINSRLYGTTSRDETAGKPHPITQLIELAKSQGFTDIECASANISGSFRRWLGHYGFKAVAIHYQVTL
jgi:hypothetical protein